ncbi:MAG: hypothetical protein QNJ78_05590 [Gammaproteobacteria bacterium]|nr:hypothetical protein [Gammaproteobacteria bacterium]
MKSKVLIASAVLLGTSIATAAPVQAHSGHDLWPLYGLTGLILYDSLSSHHHHHKHRYYDDNRGQYRHRRHHSHGRYDRHEYRHRDKHRRHR